MKEKFEKTEEEKMVAEAECEYLKIKACTREARSMSGLGKKFNRKHVDINPIL